MNRLQRIPLAGLFLGSLGLLILSTMVLFGEVAPYVVSGLEPERRFAAISGDSYKPGFSLASKEIYLRDCLDVPKTFYAMAQPTAARHRFAEACSSEADRLSKEMPAYALPWLVQASYAGASGDLSSFFPALRKAQSLAPNTLWQAEIRASLFERNTGEHAEADAQVYIADTKALLTSGRGANVVARRYVQRSELRDYITEAAESTDANVQRRFLDLVKRFANRR